LNAPIVKRWEEIKSLLPFPEITRERRWQDPFRRPCFLSGMIPGSRTKPVVQKNQTTEVSFSYTLWIDVGGELITWFALPKLNAERLAMV
jgi:hypothetical protein